MSDNSEKEGKVMPFSAVRRWEERRKRGEGTHPARAGVETPSSGCSSQSDRWAPRGGRGEMAGGGEGGEGQHCSDTGQWDDAGCQNPLFMQTHDTAGKKRLACFPFADERSSCSHWGVLLSRLMFWESHHTSVKTMAFDSSSHPPSPPLNQADSVPHCPLSPNLF